MQGHHASLGVYGVALKSKYTDSSGNRTETKNLPAAAPQFFYAYGLQKTPVTFGLGVYSPYGLGLEWPDNPDFRSMKAKINYLTLNPVIAGKIHSTISVAAGLTVNYGDSELQQYLLAPIAFPPGVRTRFDGDGTAVGFNLGLRWQPNERHAVGISYRNSTTVKLSGNLETEGPPVFPGAPPGRQSADLRFRFPQFLILGYSFRPTPDWNLEFNLDWTDWNQVDRVNLSQPSGDLTLPLNWESSFFYEFGVTRMWDNGWHVSGGYIYSENSVPSTTFTPLVPDSNRHIFSIGFGKQYDHLNWDVAYQFAYGPDRTVSGSTTLPVGPLPVASTADGQYEFTSHALTFSVGYRF